MPKTSERFIEDFDVFGRYVQSSQTENGKPVFLGPLGAGVWEHVTKIFSFSA